MQKIQLVKYNISNEWYSYDGKQHKITKKNPDQGFILFNGYEMNKKGLEKFYDDMNIWSEQIYNLERKSNTGKQLTKINVGKFKSLDSLFFTLINDTKYFKNQYIDIEHDPITEKEEIYRQGCYNSGLIYKSKEKDPETGEPKVFKKVKAYDFKNFYLGLCNSTHKNSIRKIPYKEGEVKLLDKLDFNKPPFGMFKVKIKSSHPDIFKVFSFSKDNIYTHTDIKTAYFLMKYKNMVDSMELITDEEDNAIIYTEDKLITIGDLFNYYYKFITDGRTKHPENKLLKYLGSHYYTRLYPQRKPFYVSRDDPKSAIYHMHHIEHTFTEEGDIKLNYYMLKTLAPKKSAIRLRPYVESYARHKMYSLLMESKYKINLDDVIRVYIDGVILKKRIKKKLKPVELVKEEKYHNKNIQLDGNICNIIN